MSSQLRTIYSDAFLGIHSIKSARAHERIRLEIAEPGNFIENMHKEYEDNGIGNVSASDVFRIAKLADDERDLRLGLNVACALAESDRPPSEELPKCLGSLLGACYVLNCVEVAQEMWRDEYVVQCLKQRNFALLYLMLLYNNGRYDALAELVSSGDVHRDHWTVILAALYRIGTREAYESAKNNYLPLIGGAIRQSSDHRSKYVYALFASAMGEHEHAYTFLKYNGDSKLSHYLRRNLELKILTDTERFEDALSFLREQR